MTVVSFMFSSGYDQAALAVMVVGLTVNGVIDFVRHRSRRA